MSTLTLIDAPGRAAEPLEALTTHPGASDAATLAQMAVLGLPSAHSRRAYARHIRQFLASGRPLNREGLQAYMVSLREAGAGTVTRNQALAAVRLLAREANIRGELPDVVMNALDRVRSVPVRGVRVGNWLDVDGVRAMLQAARMRTNGVRDTALLACLLGCGLRRSEVCRLEWAQWQQREGRWCWCDVEGKGGRVRTIPAPDWAAEYVNEWHDGDGRVFPISPQAVYLIVQECARAAGLPELAPHDMRRTTAKLMRDGGAPLEQVQQILGHASVQTTERYLGSKLELRPGMAGTDFIRL